MGCKQSKAVRKSLDRLGRVTSRKTRVVPIPPGMAGPIPQPSGSSNSAPLAPLVPKPRLYWDNLVLEDLENEDTDELFDIDARSVVDPPRLGVCAADYVSRSRQKVSRWLVTSSPICDYQPYDLLPGAVDSYPSFLQVYSGLTDETTVPIIRPCVRVSSTSDIISTFSLTENEADRMSENGTLTEVASTDRMSVDSAELEGEGEGEGGSVSEEDTLTKVTSIDGMSIDSEFLSIFGGTGEEGEGESVSEEDTLTEVTSIDGMSVDSEFLSIFGGRGDSRCDNSHRAISPKLNLCTEDNGIDLLNDLLLVFASKECEAMDQLPHYVLFMSLP